MSNGTWQLTPERAHELVRALVAIPSINPVFARPGGREERRDDGGFSGARQEGGRVSEERQETNRPGDERQDAWFGEARLAQYVAGFGRELNLRVEVDEVEPGRPNVLLWLPGEDLTRSLLFEAHMDTVQVDNMTVDPWGGESTPERVVGRGACDDKGSLAAMLLALESLVRAGRRPRANLCVAAVIDEEFKFSGVRHLAGRGVRFEGAIVGEPTELAPVIATKGVLRFRIEVEGRASHSAEPARGQNAVLMLADLVQRIDAWQAEAYSSRWHPLVGGPTLTCTGLQGGLGLNTIPDRAVATYDRRVIPGEDLLEAWTEIRDYVATRQKRAVVRDPFVSDEPMETAADAAVVSALREVLADQGLPADPVGVPYGTDGSKLTAVGIPTVVFGPGSITNAHKADEYIDVAEVVAAANILTELALRF